MLYHNKDRTHNCGNSEPPSTVFLATFVNSDMIQIHTYLLYFRIYSFYQIIQVNRFSDEASDIISCSGSRKYSSQSLIIYLKCGDKTNLNFVVYFPNFFV